MRLNIGQGRANHQASIAKGPLGEACLLLHWPRSAPLAAPAPASNASAVHGAAETRTATYLWRVSEGESRRDASGRRYVSFDAAVVTAAMRNATIVSDTETVNQSFGKRVCRLIVQRAS